MANTLAVKQSAMLQLPKLSEVAVEAAIQIDPLWTSDEWIASPFFAVEFSGGPGVTVWNSGRIDGDDNGNDNNVAGGGAMAPAENYIVRVEWTASGIVTKINGATLSLPLPLFNEDYLASGAQEGIEVTISAYSPGGGQNSLSLDYVDISGKSESSSPPFWTGFLGSREVGAAVVTPPEPGGGEPTVFTEIGVPYDGAVEVGPLYRWYKLTVADAATLRFSTLTSTNNAADSFLALYSATGDVLAFNEDWDDSTGNYLSQFDHAVSPGIYWLGITTYEGTATNGWELSSTGLSLDSGLILTVSEVP